MDKFRLRLENAREKTGYSKREVSLKLGFTPNVYGSYERGDRNPSLETLVQIADLFNVSIDYLLRGNEFHKTNNLEDKVIRELLNYFEELGIKQPYILDIDQWKTLTKKDIEELGQHFYWVVERRRMSD